jgi:hypothetical protein
MLKDIRPASILAGIESASKPMQSDKVPATLNPCR